MNFIKSISKYSVCVLYCMFFLPSHAKVHEDNIVLSGYIRDAISGEDLIGALILVPGTSFGVVSNEYGYFSLGLPSYAKQIKVSYLGYETQQISLNLSQSKTLVIKLNPEGIALQSIIVSARSFEEDHFQEVGRSTERLSMTRLQKMPKLLGEIDLVRNLTMMPGISTVGEGTSGFNVRGGGADENLILLDEAPVYNAAHVMGFFSVFNSDAIKDAKIYKGGLPAQYGGRLSSVLDVRQLDGNKHDLQVKGGIGNLSSRLAVEGPLIEGKTSFLVAARRSYMDQFARFSKEEGTRNSGIYFYDINAKLNHIISDKDKIYFSYYLGQDHMKLADMFKTQWGNGTMTFRWNHVFNPRLFSNLTILSSKYNYVISVNDAANAFEWKSNIRNQALKYDMSYFINPATTIDFGFHSSIQQFEPGNIFPTSQQSAVSPLLMAPEKALESAAYASLDRQFSEKLKVEIGLRLADFRRLGGIEYIYEDNFMDRSAIIDTLDYGSWGQMSSFFRMEPRLNMSYKTNRNTILKASYHHTNQFIQLISNSSAPSPIDIWKPANNYIKPAQVHQYSAGIVKSVSNRNYEFIIETFYKDYSSIVDFKDGGQLNFNRTIETEVLNGIGRAYGLELSAEKKSGKFTGRVSYTLSKSERKVDEINDGNWFDANFDKPHDLTAYAVYELNDKWNFSANIVYASGRPVTIPVSRFEHDGRVFPIMGERNAHRIPDYHRLDFAANYTPRGKKSSWSFGIYNAYGRRNAYSVFFRPTESGDGTEAVRMSVLGTVIPSFTYNFKF